MSLLFALLLFTFVFGFDIIYKKENYRVGERLFRFVFIENLCAVKVKAEKKAIIVGIIADDFCFGYHTALNDFGNADQLAKTALQVQLISVGSYQPYVALALINSLDEFFEIDFVKFYRTHILHLLSISVYICIIFVYADKVNCQL